LSEPVSGSDILKPQNVQIYLTLQSPVMISVIRLILRFHLQITTLEQVAIFNEITGIFSCFFCPIFLNKNQP
jgi:hypothetical protein